MRSVSFLLMLLCLIACGRDEGVSKYLIPYRDGDRFGLQDEAGHTVVPCRYSRIIWYPPYYHAVAADDDKVYVFDSAGRAVTGDHPLPTGWDDLHAYGIAEDLLSDRFANQRFIPSDPRNNPPPYGRHYRLNRNPSVKNPRHNQAWRQLEDAEGHVLLPLVFDVEEINYRLLFIRDIDAARSRYTTRGIYDLEKKKFVYLNPDPDNYLSVDDGFPQVKEKNGSTHYLDGDGYEIARSDRMDQVNRDLLLKKFTLSAPDSVRMRNGGYSRTYYAIRNRLDEPFMIYNDSLHILRKQYTGLWEMGDAPKWVTVRDGDLWGLLGYDLQPALPPLSDTFVYIEHDRYAVIRNKGVRYRIDLNTGDTIHANYDWLSPGPAGGKWLAADIVPQWGYSSWSNTRFERLYTIDKEGRVYDSLPLDDLLPFRYLLTPDGHYFRYPERNSSPYALSEVGITGKKEQRLPYIFGAVRKCYGIALAVSCRNEKGERALVSTLDMKEIIPFSDAEIHTFPFMIPAIDGISPGMPGLFISVEKEDGTRKTYGFYSAAGRKYWKN